MTSEGIIATAPRLILRRWHRRDYQAMDRWPSYDDPLSAIWNLPDRLSAGSDWQQDIRRTYAIERNDGTLLGRITLRDIDINASSARLGITIGSPYVSQRYGTESMQAFLWAFFMTMQFKTMLLDVASVNVRAIRCYERLGFQHTGQHWRDAGWRVIQSLDATTRHSIEPFIKYGRHTTWIQFYDMTLHRSHWQASLNELAVNF